MKQTKFCPVTLEPELEQIAALWPAAKRFQIARKFERWAKQLRVSGHIMISVNAPDPTRRQRALKYVAPRTRVMN